MPTEIALNLETATYRVVVGRDLLPTLGQRLQALETALPRDCALITDATVDALYAEPVQSTLENAGFRVTRLTVPAGEGSKSIGQAGELCERMIQAGLGRKSFVVALGGGVVGDLAGFVAGIFCRGVPVVQVPTTVMAQVDSSVGGKTGVNAPSGKNLIGVFHQPAAVFADVTTLETLPRREFCEGFAEVIKHGCIRDAAMLEILERGEDILPAHALSQDEDRLSSLPSFLEEIVARNVEIKAGVVMADEKETSGERALLNFGHTLGHGIEAAAGYGKMLHGEAISLGIVAALSLSVSRGALGEEEKNRVISLLKKFELPTRLPEDISEESILQAMKADKKFVAGQIRFVLLRTLGEAFVSEDVTLEDVQGALGELRG